VIDKTKKLIALKVAACASAETNNLVEGIGDSHVKRQ
jgi:hypothetical protein